MWKCQSHEGFHFRLKADIGRSEELSCITTQILPCKLLKYTIIVCPIL